MLRSRAVPAIGFWWMVSAFGCQDAGERDDRSGGDADADGVIYSAEVGPRSVKRYVRFED